MADPAEASAPEIQIAAPEIQIQRDKMKLTVTDIRPVLRKEAEQEARREISARLYQIFKKYGGSGGAGGGR